VFSSLRCEIYFGICSVIFKSSITWNAGRVVYRVPVVLVEGILVKYSPSAREARDFRMRRPMVLIIRGVQI
jgi:hypothetical protein